MLYPPGSLQWLQHHLAEAMYAIEALHPDGWKEQGRSKVEYWAYQEAQIRSCSDGRHYRILQQDSGRIVGMVNPQSCRMGAAVIAASSR